MCRLAYIPEPFQWKVEELTDLYDYLDKRGGGHGRGIGWIQQGEGVASVVKGLDVTPAELARITLETDSENGVIYHTRVPSVGMVCDELSQPFTIGNNALFMHNGTWGDWKAAYFALLGRGVNLPPPPFVSDSLVAAKLLEELGIEYFTLIESGVTVIMTPDQVILSKSMAGDFCQAVDTEGRLIFASVLPLSFEDKYEVRAGEVLLSNGPLDKDLLTKVRTYKFVRAEPHSGTSVWDRAKVRAAKAAKADKPTEKAEVKALLPAPTPEPEADVLDDIGAKIIAVSTSAKEAARQIIREQNTTMFVGGGWQDVISVRRLPQYPDVYVALVGEEHWLSVIGEDGDLHFLGRFGDVLRGKTLLWNCGGDVWIRAVDWVNPVWVCVSRTARFQLDKPHNFTPLVAMICRSSISGKANYEFHYVKPSGVFDVPDSQLPVIEPYDIDNYLGDLFENLWIYDQGDKRVSLVGLDDDITEVSISTTNSTEVSTVPESIVNKPAFYELEAVFHAVVNGRGRGIWRCINCNHDSLMLFVQCPTCGESQWDLTAAISENVLKMSDVEVGETVKTLAEKGASLAMLAGIGVCPSCGLVDTSEHNLTIDWLSHRVPKCLCGTRLVSISQLAKDMGW